MPLRYTYKVSRGANSYKGEEVQVGPSGWSDTKRTIYDRHGVRVVFTVSGKVGRWDFQNFILRKSFQLVDAYVCCAIRSDTLTVCEQQSA